MGLFLLPKRGLKCLAIFRLPWSQVSEISNNGCSYSWREKGAVLQKMLRVFSKVQQGVPCPRGQRVVQTVHGYPRGSSSWVRDPHGQEHHDEEVPSGVHGRNW